jgi:hypothetical protein
MAEGYNLTASEWIAFTPKALDNSAQGRHATRRTLGNSNGILMKTPIGV